MHGDAGMGLLRRTAFPPGRACRVAVPPAVHALSTLSHLDHEDAVIVEVGPDQERAGNAPSDLASHFGSSPEPRSGRGGWRSACSSVQLVQLGLPIRPRPAAG
jgi:hypothetical protein